VLNCLLFDFGDEGGVKRSEFVGEGDPLIARGCSFVRFEGLGGGEEDGEE
jgi:hypothetical protein